MVPLEEMVEDKAVPLGVIMEDRVVPLGVIMEVRVKNKSFPMIFGGT